jgi:hypothetical protein
MCKDSRNSGEGEAALTGRTLNSPEQLKGDFLPEVIEIAGLKPAL